MSIKILYFASLRARIGIDTEQFQPPATVRRVSDLIAVLRARGGVWHEALAEGAPVCVAVNQEIVSPRTAIAMGDEVAFFPPVTGG